MEEEKINFKAKYIKLRNKLFEACDEIGYTNNVIEQLKLIDVESLKNGEIIELTRYTTQFFSDILNKNFIDNWKNIIDTTYSEHEKSGIFIMLNNLSSKDPTIVYETFANTCKILNELNDEKTYKKALSFLQDYASKHTIEKVLNNYGMLLYSNFQDDVKTHFIRGFKKNKDVNYESVLAFFNEKPEPIEKGA